MELENSLPSYDSVIYNRTTKVKLSWPKTTEFNSIIIVNYLNNTNKFRLRYNIANGLLDLRQIIERKFNITRNTTYSIGVFDTEIDLVSIEDDEDLMEIFNIWSITKETPLTFNIYDHRLQYKRVLESYKKRFLENEKFITKLEMIRYE
ncbi:hypothetical protein CLIB1423_19S01112 [[Candida] railenensis]|uniref:PB1 domain-containing protein n=1 Tax=[Candida] railenensis TaxID=45579 RepID=A0A9P0QV14_9ASCO|nr:hypothetical protein CLIB1423_19S01112 [[Candida] railenensis]